MSTPTYEEWALIVQERANRFVGRTIKSVEVDAEHGKIRHLALAFTDGSVMGIEEWADWADDSGLEFSVDGKWSTRSFDESQVSA